MMREDKYNVIKLDETDSTNEYAKKLAKSGASHGTVVVARKQSEGKGRLGRSFESKEDKGIYMSIIQRPDMEPLEASRLTLIAAVAVREALAKTCQLQCDIKWPNDIVVEGKKVCGILTEMSTENGRVKYVVVGIGVNVSNKEFGVELSHIATSVYMETGRHYDIDKLISEIINKYDAYYEKYMKAGDLSVIKDDYQRYLVNIGKTVRVLNQISIEGICIGIDDEGDLLVEVEREDGSKYIEKVISGEVSVRGVYGYV